MKTLTDERRYNLTLSEVADIMSRIHGVTYTKEDIRRIERQALNKIREAVKAHDPSLAELLRA